MAGSKLRLWASETSASENATVAGLSIGEGMLPSGVNNNMRAIIGQIKDAYDPDEWGFVEYSLTCSVINQTSFAVNVDITAFAVAGRRIRLRSASTTRYATVVSSSFTAKTTVTLEDTSGSLSSSQSVVAFSAMAPLFAPRRLDKLDVSATLSVGALVVSNLSVPGSATISGTLNLSSGLRLQGGAISHDGTMSISAVTKIATSSPVRFGSSVSADGTTWYTGLAPSSLDLGAFAVPRWGSTASASAEMTALGLAAVGSAALWFDYTNKKLVVFDALAGGWKSVAVA